MPRKKIHAYGLRSPRAWPTWIAVGFGWLVARLPVAALFALGRGIGVLGYHLAGSRRHAATVNINLCFPQLSEAERAAMVRATFQHTALGALEAMLPWLNPGRDLSPHIDVTGAEHYKAAQAEGRGVLVLAAHFTTMDVISQPLARLGTFDVMYRFNKNPVWEWLQVSGRQHYFDGVVERQDTRQVLKRLKAGRSIWYAADQDYGAKHSVFAPFFGVPAATITATSRFARLNRSPVVLMTTHRDLRARRWRIEFHPALRDFPTGDDVADATAINALLEAHIRRQPEQYLWVHKRFKTRPPGEAPVY